MLLGDNYFSQTWAIDNWLVAMVRVMLVALTLVLVYLALSYFPQSDMTPAQAPEKLGLTTGR